jgi:RHS repeat-associated protein
MVPCRLQPLEIKASSTAGNALDITYNFNDIVDFPGTTNHNAGHVYGIANNLNSSRSQSFSYDMLNRIASAGTTATSGTYAWGYQYAYDNWGNLLAQAGWSPNYNGATETITSAVTADNYNHISSMSYDPSGNTLTDGSNAYTWNAESEMNTAAGVTYTYDGDGRRASKSNGKLYWYGSGGEILAETNATGATTAEYVFFGGKRVAMLPAGATAQYYVEDFLGSSRVMTTNNGTLCYDADFYPYGGERTPYTDTCTQNAYKFEGKERDAETLNDDFGARYYTWRFGRWLSADWSAVPEPVPYANLTNPQTLNLYAMVADDPETFADLDGHCGQNIDATCAWVEWADQQANGAGTRPNSFVDAPPNPAPTQKKSPGKKHHRHHRAKRKSPYQPQNKMANVLFSETGTIQGDAKSLHEMRVATGHVYMNVKHKSAFQGQNTLSAGNETAIANGVNVAAYNDSVSAAAEARSDPSDPVNGATHFFVLDVTPDRHQDVKSWAQGREAVFGPYTAGSADNNADIHVGDTIFVLIDPGP